MTSRTFVRSRVDYWGFNKYIIQYSDTHVPFKFLINLLSNLYSQLRTISYIAYE